MKKTLLIASVALVALIFAGSASAKKDSGTSLAAGLKLGYVDFNRALNETNEGKAAKRTLESEFKERQQKLDMVQNELKKMKGDLEKKRLILSPEAMKEKEMKYRDKFLELQQKLGTFKQEMAQKELTLTSGLLKKLKQIVANIGQKGNYTMILEKSQDVVLYAPDMDDLTNQVIKICNKK